MWILSLINRALLQRLQALCGQTVYEQYPQIYCKPDMPQKLLWILLFLIIPRINGIKRDDNNIIVIEVHARKN